MFPQRKAESIREKKHHIFIHRVEIQHSFVQVILRILKCIVVTKMLDKKQTEV